MLTITTTARLDALHQRAEQAETDLADTARQLEDLREEHRTGHPEAVPASSDPAAVRDRLEAAQRLAAETTASEARTRSVCDLLVKDAAKQLADRDRTIAALRSALEQARADLPAGPQVLQDTLLRFRTVGGGTVVATERESRIGSPFAWKCLACGEDSETRWYDDLHKVRSGANEHAAECRAVPAALAPAPAGKAGATT